MKIRKCGCCGSPIVYKRFELDGGYPKTPHGFCSNPKCEKYGEVNVYMKLDDLFSIINKGAKDFADRVCENNSRLQHKLGLATEALEAIATHTVFADAPEDMVRQIQTVYNIAEGALREIEDD